MKTKHFIITVSLFLSSFYLKAQDKYDFMSIYFNGTSDIVSISINGKEYLEQKMDLDKKEKNGVNLNPLFRKVEEYQQQDWEVMSYNTIAAGQSGNLNYYAFLKKKKTK